VAFAVIDDGRRKLIESGKKSVDAFKLGIFCGLPNYRAGNLKRKNIYKCTAPLVFE
jgi:hypothetical protein